MKTQSAEELRQNKCEACEGGIKPFTGEEAREQLQSLADWELSNDGKRISKNREFKDFKAGMGFLQKVAELAEEEGHHPDLHLTNYKQVSIELTTHAIGGLSWNDFILAAKIDGLN